VQDPKAARRSRRRAGSSFYADAITAAQNAVVAEQAARIAAGQLGGTNVIILLTDRNANADAEKMGTLKTASNECLAAVTAAQNSAAAGTWVYAVYYDDNLNGTCTTDTGITPARTLMANAIHCRRSPMSRGRCQALTSTIRPSSTRPTSVEPASQ
jgi:hypothetical protein